MSFAGCRTTQGDKEYRRNLQKQIDAMIPEEKAAYFKQQKAAEEFANKGMGIIWLVSFIICIVFAVWFFA